MTSQKVLHYAKLFLVSERQRTLKEDQVALVFREPGVKTGYRLPNRSWGYYLASLFNFNNETLNVWTHLIGCVFMIYNLYWYAATHGVWDDEPRRLIHVFHLCAVFCTLASAFAHAFHSRSELAHYISFQIDYIGIGLLVYSLGHVAFFISSHNKAVYETFRPTILPISVIMSWLFFLCCVCGQVVYGNKCSIRKNALQLGATIVHVFLACFGTLNRIYDCVVDDSCQLEFVMHHIKYYFFCGVAGFFFSSHLPERLLPGKCDLIGQGHQIFHVSVVAMMAFQSIASDTDIAQMAGTHPRTFPTWPQLVTALLCVLLLDAFTMMAFYKRLTQKIDKDKNI